MKDLELLLEQAIMEGAIECECGNLIEPDGICHCGAKNPLREMGLI